MKRIVCGFLTAMILLTPLGAALAQSPMGTVQYKAEAPIQGLTKLLQSFVGAKEQPAEPALTVYQLGADELASIQAIVGERACTVGTQGDTDQEYSYQSATVRDDLVAYIDYLGEWGFEVVRGAPLGEPGEGELSALSKDAGYVLSVRLYWTADGYRIHLSKSAATAAASQTQTESDWQARGREALEAELYEEALEIFDMALAENPNVAAYHGGRGEALVNLERFEEAIDSLNAAMRLDPTFWEYVGERGVAYFYLGQLEDALSDFQKAVDLNPDDAVAYINLAYVQNITGALEDSVLTCTLGISEFPDDDELWQLLGDAQYSLGHDKEALYAYDMAISFGYFTTESFPGYDELKKSVGEVDTPVVVSSKAAGTSNLMNYEDWLQPFLAGWNYVPGLFDRLLYSYDYGGIVEDVVEFPHAWPAQWLDGVIPAYTGTGWMFDLYVAHPAMSYAAKDIVHVAVTVCDYLPEEVDAYIADLLAEGFEEIQSDTYSGEWMDTVRAFRGRDFTLNIVFGRTELPTFGTLDQMGNQEEDAEDLKPFVQFNVDFDRDTYVLDTTPTANTELMNIAQWVDLTGQFEGKAPEMDQVAYSETDEDGRLYESVYYPSTWPKEIFGEMIPEFVLPAVLFSMDYGVPEANPSPDQMLIVWLYLAAFFPEYVDAYAQELIDFGYRELPPDKYIQAETDMAAEADIYRIFVLPGMRVYLSTFVEEGIERLEICLRFDGRYDNFFGE